MLDLYYKRLWLDLKATFNKNLDELLGLDSTSEEWQITYDVYKHVLKYMQQEEDFCKAVSESVEEHKNES